MSELNENIDLVPLANAENFYDLHEDYDNFDSDSATALKKTEKIKHERKYPGSVRTKAVFKMHSKEAFRLFYGRKKSKDVRPIPGLVYFSSRINLIFSAAEKDDPYADKKLIEIEGELNDVIKIIKEKNEYFTDLLEGDHNITIFPSISIQPKELQIDFRTPFGYLGLRALSLFDDMTLKALAARHTGLIFKDDWDASVVRVASRIRRTFSMVDNYRFTGLTRQDFKDRNKKALSAIAKHGEIPLDVLSMKARATMAPKVRIS